MQIAIGTDHAGFGFKEELKRFLESKGHSVKDYGTHDDAPCDYPDLALAVGMAVASGAEPCGILICGAGHGMAIAANKVPGVRAATCWDEYSTRMSRLHNDANVLVLPARAIAPQRGKDLALLFLETPFEAGRHAIRLDKIRQIERKFSK